MHQKTLNNRKIELVPLAEDLVERIWKERPSKPTGKV